MLLKDATEKPRIPLRGIPGADIPSLTGMLTGGQFVPRPGNFNPTNWSFDTSHVFVPRKDSNGVTKRGY